MRIRDVQRMLEEVLAILGKLGLQRASCRFPDWQTLDQLVQLVQMPDAAAGHNAHMRTRAQDYGPQVRARLEVGHFIPAVDHMTALRARGTYLQRTLDEHLQGARHRHPADPRRSAADHRRARRRRRSASCRRRWGGS